MKKISIILFIYLFLVGCAITSYETMDIPVDKIPIIYNYVESIDYNNKLEVWPNFWDIVDSAVVTGCIDDIFYGNGKFIAVGQYGYMQSSNDGNKWERIVNSSFDGFNIQSIRWIPELNKWVAVGGIKIGGNTGQIATSIDGDNWIQHEDGFGNDYVSGIAYGNGIAVVVGHGGKIATSTDLENWTQRNNPFGDSCIYKVDFGNNIFVACADNGKIGYSTDGINWNLTKPYFDNNSIYFVRWCGDIFIAGGVSDMLNDHPLFISVDGINWEKKVLTGWQEDVYDAWGVNGLYIVVGNYGQIKYSYDKDIWYWPYQQKDNDNPLRIADLDFISGIAANDNIIIICGEQNIICDGKYLTSRLAISTRL